MGQDAYTVEWIELGLEFASPGTVLHLTLFLLCSSPPCVQDA